MKRHACIMFPADTPYYHLDLPEYGSYHQALLGFLQSSEPFDELFGISFQKDGEKESIILQEISRQHRIKKITLGNYSWKEVFQNLWKYFSSLSSSTVPEADKDEIWFFWGDSPFINPKIAADIEDLFITYKADYAFADGYPKGIGVEILGFHRLLSMVQLAEIHEVDVTRGGLFELVQKDINSFHIETRMSQADHRLTRLELHGQYRRTHVQVVQLAREFYRSRNPDPWSDQDFEVAFWEKSFTHRSLPAAINLQISARCPHSCNYCPYPVLHPDHSNDSRSMSLESLKRLIEKLQDWMPEGTISLSGLGEPALHPEIEKIIEYLDFETPYSITIETTGVGWKESLFELLAKNLPKKTSFIIGLDTNNKERYDELGKKGFEEAQKFALEMIQRLKGQVYVQAIRLKGAEEDLLRFYQEWEKIHPGVIIQKYDTYSGFLPDRKVVDLQPVKRFPCWHLKREMNILLDGTVVRCKEDLKAEDSGGNVFVDSLDAIWEHYQEVYDLHRNGSYPGICGNCDEYYTYGY